MFDPPKPTVKFHHDFPLIRIATKAMQVFPKPRSSSYKSIGLSFSLEKHGNGPEHLAAEIDGVVFEIYPRKGDPASTGVRLGFRVASVEAVVVAARRSYCRRRKAQLRAGRSESSIRTGIAW